MQTLILTLSLSKSEDERIDFSATWQGGISLPGSALFTQLKNFL